MNRLKDKVVIITGANSGIGAKAAELMALEGAKVVISARRKEALDVVANNIKALGGEVLSVPTDVSKIEDCQRLVEETLKHFKTIDVLINNAGVLDTGINPIDAYLDEEVDYCFNINSKGPMQLMRLVAPLLANKNGGSIVNVASQAGIIGNGGAAYVASKGAVVALTKHAALRYAQNHVRVNVLCPGSVMTPMTMNMDRTKTNQDMMGAIMKHSDLTVGFCSAEDVANAIVYFASDESKCITGQQIVMDYGSSL